VATRLKAGSKTEIAVSNRFGREWTTMFSYDVLFCVDRGFAWNKPMYMESYQTTKEFISSKLILKWKKLEYVHLYILQDSDILKFSKVKVNTLKTSIKILEI
jgi:hypothetical protein